MNNEFHENIKICMYKMPKCSQCIVNPKLNKEVNYLKKIIK